MITGHRPCICGHIKNFHQYSPDIRHVVCWAQLSPNSKQFCDCYKFKLDNLVYLEELYEEKNK